MLTTIVTDIGDSLVMSGIVATGAAYLFARGCRKGAIALLLSLAGASALISLAKLAFIGCRWRLQSHFDLHSPSGHSALSIAVIGTYALLTMSQLQGLKRLIPIIIAIPLILAIAITRIWLNFHSISEVMVGLAIGGITLTGIYVFLRRGEKVHEFNVCMLMFIVVLTAAILHGYRSPAEQLIRLLASYVHSYVPLCAK